MTHLLDSDRLERALVDLGAVLADRGERYELCVIGGGAFLLNDPDRFRATADLDVAAEVEPDATLSAPVPLPEPLALAVAQIARAHDLAPHWINSAAAASFGVMLPDGFLERSTRHEYGGLVLQVAARIDLLKLKLQAAQRRGAPGARHLDDVARAQPSAEEIAVAADWVRARHADPMASAERLEQVLLDLRARLDG